MVSIAVFKPNSGIQAISVSASNIRLLIKDLEEIAKRIEKLGIQMRTPEEL